MTVLVEPHGSGRLADHDRDRFGLSRDRGGRPVTCAEPLGHGQVFVRDFQHLAASFDHAVAVDDEGPIELSDLLGVFLNLGVKQIAVLAIVASKGIHATVVGMLQDASRIADDKQRPDRFALAAFAADLGGQDRTTVLMVCKGHSAFEHLQVTAGQTPHPLIELQVADRIEPSLLEPTVNRHNFAIGPDQLIGGRLEQGML